MRGTPAKTPRRDSAVPEAKQTTEDLRAGLEAAPKHKDHFLSPQAVAQRLREAPAVQRPKRTGRPPSGKSRHLRREEKFKPLRHEIAQQEADPAARRNHARRWNFIYSKAARKAAEKITRKKEPEWTDPGQEPS